MKIKSIQFYLLLLIVFIYHINDNKTFQLNAKENLVQKGEIVNSIQKELETVRMAYVKVGSARGTQEALQAEEIYLKTVEVYSNIDAFVEESLNVAKNNSSFSEDASVVVLSSNNQKAIDELLKFVSSDDSKVAFEKVLGRLNETKQKQIIERLLKLNTKKSLNYAINSILANGYKEYVDALINEETINKLENKQIGYALLCRMGGKEGKKLALKLFNNAKHPLIKEKIALELIHTKSKEAREYIKELYSIESYEAFAYLSFSEDNEFVQDVFLEKYEELDEEFMAAFYKMFSLWYGNPKLIPFYVKMLQDKDVAMQFSELILKFFYDDVTMNPLRKLVKEWDKELEEIEELEYKSQKRLDDLFEEKSTQVQNKIIEFWENKENYILQKLDNNKRYYADELFNLSKIWQDEMVDNFYDRWAKLTYKGLMLLTGEYFAFDVNGLRSRQFEQSKIILKYLDENKEKYAPGNWTVWGMDYKTFTQFNEK